MVVRAHRPALVALMAAALAAFGFTTTAAADPVLSRSSYAPTTSWRWVDDTGLGTTTTTAQYAQADVSGLTDKDHGAGFRLRHGPGSDILVAVSGTEWKTEPSGGTVVNGAFAHSASGRLRVTVDAGNTARVYWNGAEVGSRHIPGTYPHRGIAPSVWQSSPGVHMTNLEAGTLPTTAPTLSPTTAPGPTTSPAPRATVTVTPTVTAAPVTRTAAAVTVTPGFRPSPSPLPLSR